MKQENDILQDPRLKEMRPKAPEGYFEELPSRIDHVLGRRTRPVAVILCAAAASLLVLIAAGAIFLSNPSSAPGKSENVMDLQASAAELSNDDIVQYLIWSGAGIEEFAAYME